METRTSVHFRQLRARASRYRGLKVGYDVTKVVNAGFEYYGSVGPVTAFAPYEQQEQQIFAVTDLNFSQNWEFNLGVGFGLTSGSAPVGSLIVKMILGRRVVHKN